MFSTGVFIALLSAKLAAAEVIGAHRQGQRAVLVEHDSGTRAGLGKNLATLERMVLAFYDDAAFSVFMERNPPLLMGRAINALVAGHSDPPWPVRWRYWLFLLVCRVQRWRPIVPMVDLSPRDAAPASNKTPCHAEAAVFASCDQRQAVLGRRWLALTRSTASGTP